MGAGADLLQWYSVQWKYEPTISSEFKIYDGEDTYDAAALITMQYGGAASMRDDDYHCDPSILLGESETYRIGLSADFDSSSDYAYFKNLSIELI